MRLVRLYDEECHIMYPVTDIERLFRHIDSLYTFMSAALRSGFAQVGLPGEDAMDDADDEWPFKYWQGVEMGERPEAVKEALQKMVKEHAQAFAGSQQAKRDVEDYYEADVSDEEEHEDIQSQFGYGMIAVRAFG